jgi:membrane fusion protein (multidrug efflux system)
MPFPSTDLATPPLRRRAFHSLILALAPVASASCERLCASEASSVHSPAVSASSSEPIAVTTVAAESRALEDALVVTGSLEPDAKTDLAPEVDGRVASVLVERGQSVAAGEVVVELDARDSENRLNESLSVLAQTREALGLATSGELDATFDPEQTPAVREARVTLERAKLDFDRYARLVAEGAVSQLEYDHKRAEKLEAQERANSAVQHAREQFRALEAQRARVELARKALEDTRVRAPYAGRVMERTVDAGQFVRRGERVATLLRVDPLRAELTIPESAVGLVHVGQKVSFTVQAWPDRRFEGVVAFVGPGLRSDSRSLVVEARVENDDGALQPGLFATASIAVTSERRSVLVPAAAIATEGDVHRLFVAGNGRAQLRLVQLGRTVGDQVEVTRGVDAGESVVVQSTSRIGDGAAVVAATCEKE